MGSALQRGLERAGYEVRSAGHDEKKVRETGTFGEVVILAVPFGAIDETVRELGDTIQGKPLIDVTNAVGKDMQLAVGLSTSGAEELQRKAPAAKVVKCFNTVFAQHQDSGHVAGEQITAFAAGDDAAAKSAALDLASSIGFDAVDAGPLKNARWLEALAVENIQLGYVLGMGPQIGIKLVH